MSKDQNRAELSTGIINSVNAIGRALRRPPAPAGGEISLGELGILKAVAAGQHEPGRTRPSAIAQALSLDLSVVSRRLPALEAAGLIERVADPADRRAQVIALTPAGAERLGAVSSGAGPAGAGARGGAPGGEIGLAELGILQAVAAQAQGRGRPSAIAEALSLDLSVVSRRLPALEAAGLIERVADPADRRAQVIALTPAGAERLARLNAAAGQALAARLGDWDTSDLESLARLMRRLELDLAPGQQG
jgi:DNA-binding MarR family transcriptional regulator